MPRLEEAVGIFQHPLLLLIAEDHSQVVVEQGDTAREIVDDGFEESDALAQGIRSGVLSEHTQEDVVACH